MALYDEAERMRYQLFPRRLRHTCIPSSESIFRQSVYAAGQDSAYEEAGAPIRKVTICFFLKIYMYPAGRGVPVPGVAAVLFRMISWRIISGRR